MGTPEMGMCQLSRSGIVLRVPTCWRVSGLGEGQSRWLVVAFPEARDHYGAAFFESKSRICDIHLFH